MKWEYNAKVSYFDLLSPKSDQHQFSLTNAHSTRDEEVEWVIFIHFQVKRLWEFKKQNDRRRQNSLIFYQIVCILVWRIWIYALMTSLREAGPLPLLISGSSIPRLTLSPILRVPTHARFDFFRKFTHVYGNFMAVEPPQKARSEAIGDVCEW